MGSYRALWDSWQLLKRLFQCVWRDLMDSTRLVHFRSCLLASSGFFPSYWFNRHIDYIFPIPESSGTFQKDSWAINLRHLKRWSFTGSFPPFLFLSLSLFLWILPVPSSGIAFDPARFSMGLGGLFQIMSVPCWLATRLRSVKDLFLGFSNYQYENSGFFRILSGFFLSFQNKNFKSVRTY